jgi:hypothetical protein
MVKISSIPYQGTFAWNFPQGPGEKYKNISVGSWLRSEKETY